MRQWPNKLGYDVGRSEVRNCVTFLRTFVPITPHVGYSADGKRFAIDRHKRMDFSIGTDPRECVRVCRKNGSIHRDD
jgi:hypothetical protein